MIKLKNRRLEISFETPGEEYNGARYDWSSFITDVILDGENYFTGVESKIIGYGCGGKGLCGEFSMHDPLGYDDTAIGDWFIKVGVGLLQKEENKPYSFGDDLKVKPICWEVNFGNSHIELSCSQELHNGFAYDLYKNIQLNDNVLSVDYRLVNRGVRDIVTSEYIHNYFCFNDRDINNEYILDIDFNSVLNAPKSVTKNKKVGCSFRDITLDERFYQDIDVCVGEIGSWKLSHKFEGIWVKEYLSEPMVKFAVFADSHIICPEMFVGIKVPVREDFSWKRKWEFDKLYC